MNRLGLSFLAIALAAASGGVAAQSPYGEAPYGDYSDRYAPEVYRDGGRGEVEGARYDYARVLRVDPVIVQGRGYPTRDGRRCETRRDGYAGSDPYRDDGDDGYGDGGYADRGYRDDDRYRNDPYRNDPYRNERRDDNGRMVATVIGGIAGAVLGSKIGDGSGQYIGTAVGSMVGGMAGRGIYDANRRARRPQDGYVTVCEPDRDGGGYDTGGRDDRAVDGYDVTYEYAGRLYTTRTPYHPGDRIRVRVDVRAD